MIYMYSIQILNADIILICVYMYYIYTVFVVVNNWVFECIILIVKLNIILVYYQFYLLCTNKDYYDY